MMEIRPTEIKDLPLVMEIYDYARAFMRATGNTTQWIDGWQRTESRKGCRKLVWTGVFNVGLMSG